MKKINCFFGLAFSALFLTSCGYSVEFDDLQQLDGYWEITKVKKPNGQVKKYKMSKTMDYINVDSTNHHGIRKKAEAMISGKFKVTNDYETFKVKKIRDTLRLIYQTEMSQWKETLLRLDENNFAVRNKRGIIYIYQRYDGKIYEPKQ